jgi:CheY-like chemotaxis protein
VSRSSKTATACSRSSRTGPRRNGREVLAVLKTDPLLRSIPVLILSTSSAERDVASCYEGHANAYLVKPADFTQYRQLLAIIAQFWFSAVTLPPEVAHV